MFGWQGGEPSLMGVDFFRDVVRLQSSLARPGTRISNGFQTNGTLLSDEWAQLFAEYRFLVGVSVDGPARIHDRFRVDLGERGTHARVWRGIAALKRRGVEYNVLTLVSRSNVKHPEAVYDELCKRGVFFHQYIECVEFEKENQPQPYAIRPEEWGDFLCRIFDRWYPRDVRRVSVRLFDTVLCQLVDGVSNTCASGRSCDQYFVVEYNGDVYPCDFHVREDLRLGNVLTDSWESMQNSEAYRSFASAKTRCNRACDACPWLRFCHGDCPKNRTGGVSKPDSLSYLCAGWKQFYAHTLPRFEQLATEIRRMRIGL